MTPTGHQRNSISGRRGALRGERASASNLPIEVTDRSREFASPNLVNATQSGLSGRADRVLALLRGTRRALSAYEMIASLREEGERIAPVQMYRVLGALIQAGHVIKVESRHGYIAAQRAHAAGDPVALLVCACCGGVEEAPDAVAASVLAPISALRAFKPSSRAIEVLGACGNCQSEPTVMNSHAAPRE